MGARIWGKQTRACKAQGTRFYADNKVNILQVEADELWITPRAFLKDDGTLGYYPALKHWVGDSHFAFINLAKHIYFFDLIYKNMSNGFDSSLLDIFVSLTKEMNECAIQHGSKFATIILDEDNNLPPKYMRPTDFPYVFATNGFEGEEKCPKHKVGGIMWQHPYALVHRNWAKHIKEWFDSYRTKNN